MKSVFSFLLAILLTVGVFRVLNDKDFIGVKGVISTFSTYDFDFSESKELVDYTKLSIDQLKITWEEFKVLFEQPLSGHNLIFSLTLRALNIIKDFIQGLYRTALIIFNLIGVLIAFIVDIVKNLYNLFNLAISLLGFSIS